MECARKPGGALSAQDPSHECERSGTQRARMTDTSKDPKDQEGQEAEVRKLPSQLEFVVKLTYWPRESPGSRRGHLSAPKRVTPCHHGPGYRRMVVGDVGAKAQAWHASAWVACLR